MHQRPYERLIVWQESHSLFLWINGLTKKFPSEERFELTSQIRRAAYSVPMNIAEGNTKRTPKNKRKFFEIAMGSLEELHYQGRICSELKYISVEEFQTMDDRINRVSYLLTRLRDSF